MNFSFVSLLFHLQRNGLVSFGGFSTDGLFQLFQGFIQAARVSGKIGFCFSGLTAVLQVYLLSLNQQNDVLGCFWISGSFGIDFFTILWLHFLLLNPIKASI